MRTDPRSQYETPAAHERIGVRAMRMPGDWQGAIARDLSRLGLSCATAANTSGARRGSTVVVGAA